MKYIGLLSSLLLLAAAVFAQSPIQYTISPADLAHHEIRIRLQLDEVPEGPLKIRMPDSSPGRYAEHSFAKNVYAVKAYDQNGKSLQVDRNTPKEWQVSKHTGTVIFEYTLFGNHADGTYTGIDRRKIHMNMPATFAYAVGYENRPIELSLQLESLPAWKVATQLKQIGDNHYWAPNYYYFYDSPTIAGEMDYEQFLSGSDTIAVAMLHEGTSSEFQQFVSWVERVVNTEKQVYGELPKFDYGKYTFLCSYNPWVKGDGMEHRNSTICTYPGSLAENDTAMVGTVAHEFFHAWNVERLRPATLEPFDFDRANMSDALWFAEGFTSYYDDLTLRRAGIFTPQQYVEGLSGTLNYVLNFPGRQFGGPIHMSQTAPFVDAAAFGDETNFTNTYISYYPYGAVLGLGLDLTLRSNFKDITLDDYMRLLWKKFGQPEKPYAVKDLETALAELTGDATFASEFFRNYIYNSQLPDYKALFADFGVNVALSNANGVYMGPVRLNFGEAGAELRGPVLKGTALYEAGINSGDVLLSLNGKAINSQADWEEALQQLKPGEQYEVSYRQLGKEYTQSFTAKPDPSFRLQLMPEEALSKKVKKRRDAWLANSDNS